MKDSAFSFDSALFFLSTALVFPVLYMTSSGPFRGTDFVGLALLEAELENVKKGSICAADLDQAFLKAVTQYKKKGTGDTIIREEIPLRSTEECAPLDETMQSSFNGLFGGKIIRTGTSAPPPPPPARAPVFQSSMPIVSPSIYSHPHRRNGNFVPPPYYYNIVVEITKDQKSQAQTNADCAKDLLRAFHQARDAFFATQRPVVGVTHPNYYIEPFKPKAVCAGLAA